MSNKTEALTNIRYRVELHQSERDELKALLASGKKLIRRLKRAQILMAADQGASGAEIAECVVCGMSTVTRTRRGFVEGSLELTLCEAPRSGAARKLTGRQEALLVATACSKQPIGRACWTLELLCGEMVRLTEHESLSSETVHRRLSENGLKPWRKDMWCIPKLDAAFVAAMEDVLDLYSETPDPDRPVVRLDESPVQLIGETRTPVPARPGQPRRFDYEYRRNGTANLSLLLDAHQGWRKVKVTERRTAADFAACMRDPGDLHFPEAEKIRVVLDNLSTHTPAALYTALPAQDARRILRRIEFHQTPKHASWLNMVEIEIGVLQRQCLGRRITDRVTHEAEIAAWETQRNQSRARTNWMFTTANARDKLAKAYPKPSAPKQSIKRVKIAVTRH